MRERWNSVSFWRMIAIGAVLAIITVELTVVALRKNVPTRSDVNQAINVRLALDARALSSLVTSLTATDANAARLEVRVRALEIDIAKLEVIVGRNHSLP